MARTSTRNTIPAAITNDAKTIVVSIWSLLPLIYSLGKLFLRFICDLSLLNATVSDASRRFFRFPMKGPHAVFIAFSGNRSPDITYHLELQNKGKKPGACDDD